MSQSVRTNSQGVAQIDIVSPRTPLEVTSIRATATSPGGNTSMLSGAVTA